MVTTYTTAELVLEEAGLDDDQEDITPEEIEKKILAAEIIINNYTQHEWLTTDNSFPLVEQVAVLLASSFVMDKFDDPKGEAEKNFNKGMMLLEMLTNSDEVASDVNIQVTEYQTFPANPTAKWSRGRLSTVPISNVTSEDELLEEASL